MPAVDAHTHHCMAWLYMDQPFYNKVTLGWLLDSTQGMRHEQQQWWCGKGAQVRYGVADSEWVRDAYDLKCALQRRAALSCQL